MMYLPTGAICAATGSECDSGMCKTHCCKRGHPTLSQAKAAFAECDTGGEFVYPLTLRPGWDPDHYLTSDNGWNNVLTSGDGAFFRAGGLPGVVRAGAPTRARAFAQDWLMIDGINATSDSSQGIVRDSYFSSSLSSSSCWGWGVGGFCSVSAGQA